MRSDQTSGAGKLAPRQNDYLTQCSNDVEAASGPGGALPTSGGGGPLTNGGIQTGEIVPGEVDTWTFTATAGDRIAVHVGEITDANDFRPRIRLLAPDGSALGDVSGVAAATIDAASAPISGTYLVLVASFDSGFDGTGTYQLTATVSP